MNKVKFHLPRKQPHLKPLKYEMVKRKEKWKALNDPIEKQLSIPPESQPAVVQELVSEMAYEHLASLLDLPKLMIGGETSPSVETLVPYLPPDTISEQDETQDSLQKRLRASAHSTVSGSTASSQYESLASTIVSKKSESLTEIKSETERDSDTFDDLSDVVEVEKKSAKDYEMMRKHKAILRFLSLPEAEAASWRVKDEKDVSDLSQMTLEEKGDYLINKIAEDFCKWIRELGGDEKSFISEEVVKELFQIGMDNPASRAICMKTNEKRVLYYNLATFLNMPDKSFHEVLLKHLNWDAEVEQKPSKVEAFGKSLPKNLRFKTPKNKTAETWLEWNKLSEEQLSFADVYKDIKDLRSTKEYCRWMVAHPEHMRPQYLVDQHMFDDPKPTSKNTDERFRAKPHKTLSRVLFADNVKRKHIKQSRPMTWDQTHQITRAQTRHRMRTTTTSKSDSRTFSRRLESQKTLSYALSYIGLLDNTKSEISLYHNPTSFNI